jgi:hypothetical protein
MSDEFQSDTPDSEARTSQGQPAEGRIIDIAKPFLGLPDWLARRVIRPGEEITWLFGPRHNPAWERYATHPALFLVALALGALCIGAGSLLAQVQPEFLPVMVGVAFVIVFGSIFVLGFCSGYFTRLVVTNFRLVVLQGYEVCRSWNIDELPPSLVRYRNRGTKIESRTVDLDTLKTMIGGTSDKVEGKSIMVFTKQMDRIRRDKDRP